MNPDETKERADEFLLQKQRYTLGQAIKLAVTEKLYSPSIQSELDAFLELRNWLVHNVICGNEEDFNAGVIKMNCLIKSTLLGTKLQLSIVR
ncbi:hypothetical protein SAMN05421827_10994 [Pedobacter terrae]|uniref:Apea-like HEPN domain-containing protein n=1 Tax=Pedobacter terrae TaxID=405671 RepID=A0A1G7W4A9_9SPHI|nr:hypothetical protein [Pedobacter terrae]SDG66797.1 hypothetical protein SAMN05421827_10994 [Pedobacter terrae]